MRGDELISKIHDKCNHFTFDGQSCEKLIKNKNIILQKINRNWLRNEKTHFVYSFFTYSHNMDGCVILGIYSTKNVRIDVSQSGIVINSLDLMGDEFHFLLDNSHFILFDRLMQNSNAFNEHQFELILHNLSSDDEIILILAKTSESYQKHYSFHFNDWTVQNGRLVDEKEATQESIIPMDNTSFVSQPGEL